MEKLDAQTRLAKLEQLFYPMNNYTRQLIEAGASNDTVNLTLQLLAAIARDVDSASSEVKGASPPK